jgi:hypothetical protein
MSHQYIEKSELKTYLGMSGTAQDNNLDFALDAASAAIDDFCGRVFYQTDVQDRFFDCEFSDYVMIDDIATTTNLVVKTLNSDGSDDETLTLDTDFYLYPQNANQKDPKMPFDKIVMAIEVTGKILPTKHPRGIKVTAKFGFPTQSGSETVPAAIQQATLIQASRFFQRKNSPMGFSGNPETGQAPVIFLSELDPDVQTLCKKFKKTTMVLASGRPYVGVTQINRNRIYGA